MNCRKQTTHSFALRFNRYYFQKETTEKPEGSATQNNSQATLRAD